MSAPTQVVKIPRSINKKVLFVVEKITKFLLAQHKDFSIVFDNNDNNATIEEEGEFRKVEGDSISISIEPPIDYGEVAEFLEKLGFIAVNGVENKVAQYISFEQSLFQEEWEKDVLEREYGNGRKVVRIVVVLKGVTTNDKSTVDFIMVYPKILIWKK